MDGDGGDEVSLAGTDFNEPWDSNAWENLLDLARFGDEKPTPEQAINTLHSNSSGIGGSCSAADQSVSFRRNGQLVPHGREGVILFEEEMVMEDEDERSCDLPSRYSLAGVEPRGEETEAEEEEVFSNGDETPTLEDKPLASEIAALLSSKGGSEEHASANTPMTTKHQHRKSHSMMNVNTRGGGVASPLSLHSPMASQRHVPNGSHHRAPLPTAFQPLTATRRVGDHAFVIQNYVEMLAADESTLFGATLHRFIECTLESEKQDPHVVIRRVRQFLNGMKNYLVKNGELELHQLIEQESDKLAGNEFLNIDAIFEEVG